MEATEEISRRICELPLPVTLSFAGKALLCE
jgi:hypothetical protein